MSILWIGFRESGPEDFILKHWQAAVLGSVQGITEFLPVSSTAHIHLVSRLFRWQSPGLVLDTSLHLGTLAATLVWAGREQYQRRIVNLPLVTRLAVSTLPAALAGFFLEKWIESRLRQPWISALMLMLGGALFWGVEKHYDEHRASSLAQLSAAQALGIGLAQMLALIPGLSRSGMTLAGGLALGLKREDALRYSFLLSLPVVAGSGLFKLRELARRPHLKSLLLTGGTCAALSGYLCLQGLFSFFQSGALRSFGVYRMALGAYVLLNSRTRS